jgi:type II secretory pathway pseudopilin PulG
LVELLVVIGITALLISILLPALHRVRRAATDVKCLSNLRALGQGLATYAANNRNWWPAPAQPTVNPVGWTNPTLVGTYWSRDYILPLLTNRQATVAETINNTFVQNSVFQCPAAAEQTAGLSQLTIYITDADQQQRSYGMSARLNDVQSPPGGDHTVVNGVREAFKSASKVHNPSQTCLLIDNVGFWSGTITDGTQDSQWVRLRAAVRRHTPSGAMLNNQYTLSTINTAAARAEKGTLNVLYADYHATPKSYIDIPKAVDITGSNATAAFFQFWCGNTASKN